MYTRRGLAATVLLVGALYHSPLLAAGVAPGDIVVADVGNDDNDYHSSLVIVDPHTGKQSVLSSGGLLDIPRGMAFDRTGHRLLVVNYGTLIAVDASTGEQSFITTFSGLVDAIAVEGPGRFLLTDYNGRLLRYEEVANSVQVVASGGLIGGVAPWSIQLGNNGEAIVSSLTAEGLDAPGLPTRVILIDPSTGAQSLVFESLDLQLRDFVVFGNEIVIVTNSRGYPFPSGSDGVSRLDLRTGLLTPIYSGLERALDVDELSDGRLSVLDQILTLEDIRSPVVYRERGNKLQALSSYGYMSIPARSVAVQCLSAQDCRRHGKIGTCDLQGACKYADN